ncbi:MAG: CTP synthase [Elusimicrobia bacterium]|nr:CTP synthase [Elusimicrobiota bacterium]
MKTKFIFVTGGVVSSLGKGLASASIGALLESRGLTITLQKLDPYINVDPGTMSPFQHGEVFVTDDGAETDLDLGHYERFTSAKLTRRNNFTTGQVYDSIITKERRGDYLGCTVQVVPHVTDEIKGKVLSLANNVDIAIIEIGGTVGDIESLPFLEAIRQLRFDLGRENVLYIHLTLLPYIATAHEIKTKPTQHSVNKLREIGIQPDIIVCRSEKPLSSELKAKIALFCSVPKEAVIEAADASTIYEVPLLFQKQGLDEQVLMLLRLRATGKDLEQWQHMVERVKNPKAEVTIALAGKYTELKDAYKSVHEALAHGGLANNVKVHIKYVDTQAADFERALEGVHGILVPGGFGDRGVEGKIRVVQYARENQIPYFGLCLGMQIATIEFARNVLKLSGAHSTEFDPKTRYPVIDLLPEQRAIKEMGATMRLGSYPCVLKKGSLAQKAYGASTVTERHRHRFELNNKFRKLLEDAGFHITGSYAPKNLAEIIELRDHPWFLAVQFHPEFKSRPLSPHPLFASFIDAAVHRAHGTDRPARAQASYAR